MSDMFDPRWFFGNAISYSLSICCYWLYGRKGHLVTNHPLLGNRERVKRREYGRNKKNL